MKKVLIAYMSKTNTTREVAEYIRKNLQTKEIKIDILKFHEVENITDYQFVIVGAPINGMMWIPQAHAFVQEHQQALKQIPVAYFFVSYLFKNGRKMWRNAINKSLDKPSALVKPVAVGKFTGRVEKKFPKFFAFVFGVKKDLPLNLVDLTQADEFIEQIKQNLK